MYREMCMRAIKGSKNPWLQQARGNVNDTSTEEAVRSNHSQKVLSKSSTLEYLHVSKRNMRRYGGKCARMHVGRKEQAKFSPSMFWSRSVLTDIDSSNEEPRRLRSSSSKFIIESSIAWNGLFFLPIWTSNLLNSTSHKFQVNLNRHLKVMHLMRGLLCLQATITIRPESFDCGSFTTTLG